MDMESAAKMGRIENDKPEMVVEKRCWRMNNKDMYRIMTSSDKMLLDRSVLDKEVYDKIAKGSTYKFVYQKINRFFYIIDFVLCESQDSDTIKDCLTYDDFDSEIETKIYAFVLCAYEVPDYNGNNFSNVKVCTIIKRENDYVQCDLIISLSSLGTFDINNDDKNSERVTKALKFLYDMKDKWCVLDVQCSKTTIRDNVYCKLMLKHHSKIELATPEVLENFADMIGDQYFNISYMNKLFKCVQVTKLSCTEADFVHKITNKKHKLFKLVIETGDDERLEATAFINNVKQEDRKVDLQAVNINVANGEIVYAVLNKKPGDDKYCLTAVMTYCTSDNDFYSIYC